MFGDINEVHWVSKIELSRNREENIRDYFVHQIVNSYYPNKVEDFNDLLEIYTQKKAIILRMIWEKI